MVPCGVAVLVFRQGAGGVEVLTLKRKGAHGAGTWSLPGGRLEPGEQPLDAAKRELAEETSLRLDVQPFHSVPYVAGLAGGEPWVTLFFVAQAQLFHKARLLEPDKCEELKWSPWGCLPAPMFEPFEEMVRRYDHWMENHAESPCPCGGPHMCPPP